MGLPRNVLDGTILESWGIIFVAAIGLILACLFAGISYLLCRSKRDMIIEKVRVEKKKMIWSALIESYTIEYVLMLTTIVF